MIDLKTLKSLVKLMADNELTEMNLEDDGEKVHLKRGGNDHPHMVHTSPAMPSPLPMSHAQPVANQAAPTSAESAPAAAPVAEGPTIDSPMVGTFYAASNPDSPPFVSVGDTVDEDTVVCIVEAMKVFNEIKAEKKGTVTEVLVANGDAVEFGQPLFRIKA